MSNTTMIPFISVKYAHDGRSATPDALGLWLMQTRVWLHLGDQNKSELARCAEGILLTREAHFPATIAELYDPDKMPADLRAAHERNDEVLERIYIGRRLKNDTERLEMLLEMYSQMIAKQPVPADKPGRRRTKGSQA